MLCKSRTQEQLLSQHYHTFCFAMENLPTYFISRTTCLIVFASPWGAWQLSVLWKHLSKMYLGTLSTTTSLFHVHSCYLMHTGTSKDTKDLTQRCCCSLLIYPLHWIPGGQLEEKIWRWQLIKPYCLLKHFSSLSQFANPVIKQVLKTINLISWEVLH